MRVSKTQAAANRQRIVTEAARLFREHGLSNVGVDALAEAAGLTHGSLYSQFGSKERLAAEALGYALAKTSQRMAASRTRANFVERYLSASHRDHPGDGCVLAALGSEVARQSPAIRRSFTEALQATQHRIAEFHPEPKLSEDQALAFLATLVGALTLARAVDDPQFSDRILAAARRELGSR
jgi:TetR/AcrR family transcriptional regulator, transcriptional repressor for nem operon